MRSVILVLAGAAVVAIQPWREALASAVAQSALPHQLSGRLVRELATGKLLVAARNLPDPNFAETVVLLTDVNAEGAMGLIVNRPTEVPLARLLPDVGTSPVGEMAVFFGGPVPERGALALFRSSASRSDVHHVVDDVYLVNSRKALDSIVSSGPGSARFRVYVGYSGWGAGQLQRETALGSWHLVDGDGGVVFDPDTESLWRRLMRRIEARSARHDRGIGPCDSRAAALLLAG